MRVTLFVGAVLALVPSANAQLAPTIGYVHPAGVPAGRTVEVTLGGYDWTPDMQVFVHDPRIELELVGAPSPVLVPEPPYWFGKKARRPPFLLPREFRARLTIPADVPPGLVTWQVANANGASPTARFVVAAATSNEALEDEEGDGDSLPVDLPVTISGRIRRIEEVDRCHFTATRSGLVTCRTTAHAIGSDLDASVEVRDDRGRLVADAADTAGDDLAVTFAVERGRTYTVSLHDVDFRGNRSFVYRMSLDPGPRVVAAIPTTAFAGSTREVEFVGYGFATGGPIFETVSRSVSFPAEPGPFEYELDTPRGTAGPFRLFTTDVERTIARPSGDTRRLVAPVLVTDVLRERYAEKRYTFEATKGSVWSIVARARSLDSSLDTSVAVYDSTGKELARNDDLLESTDASLQFSAKADGEYTIGVTDVAGRSGHPAAVFELEFAEATPGFSVELPDVLSVPIGGTTKLTLKATRVRGWNEAISLRFEGLPDGVTLPENVEIPAKRPSASLEFTADAEAASSASLAKLICTAEIDGETVSREIGPILVAVTIPPPFEIDAEGKDDVTKWPRGTTFPAPVLIERHEGFDGEIVLEMTSKQGRHRQGITGPELVVAPGVERILYPVHLPEWLETTRTSRMVVNGVAKVADPQGNVRYSVARQKTRMGFLPVGALLKLSANAGELVVSPGTTFRVPVQVARAEKLSEPLRIELVSGTPGASAFAAEPLVLEPGDTEAEFPIEIAVDVPAGEFHLTLRATAMKEGRYPVVSESSFVAICRH